MANVLPADAQKKVWAMYRARLALVTGLFLFGFSAAFALTLFPSYAALRSVAKEGEASGAAFEAGRADADALERSRFLLEALGPTLSATSSLEAVVSALALRPSGVRVTRIMYSKKENEGTITLMGSATRDQVSAYRDALAKSASFTSVSVPASALVGSGGGNFSVVLTGSF